MTEEVSFEYYLDENEEETKQVKTKTVVYEKRKTVMNFLIDGTLSEKKEYVNNVIHERFVYYETGEIHQHEKYVKNALRKRSIYYETGELYQHEEYNKNEELHGDFIEFYMNGQCRINKVYVSGIINRYVEYNEDGMLMMKKNYDSTGVEIHGEKTKLYDNGNVQTYMNYLDGVLMRWTNYYDNGDLMIDRTYYETGGKHGEWIFYNKDKSIYTIHRYYNDLLHHEILPSHVLYYDNGKCRTVEYYHMGNLHCDFGPARMTFIHNGYKKEFVSYYKHGKRHNDMGPAWTRYRDNKPWFAEYYMDGRLVKKETYY